MKTTPLTTVIEMRDKDGRVTGRKEVATYQGLLAKAHDEGLRSIRTDIVQAPTKDNGETAIVRAVVRTQRGTFTGIGDANPGNVNRRIAAHVLRMAETRAKARALRDAVNIGTVALEELGELLDDDATDQGTTETRSTSPGNGRTNGDASAAPTPAAPATAQPAATTAPATEPPMSESQRRFLFRLASARGLTPETAQAWLERESGVASLKALSRNQASRLIDRLQGNGAGGVA